MKTKLTGRVQRLAIAAPDAAQRAFEAYCNAEALTGRTSFDPNGATVAQRTWSDLNEHARAVWQIVADAVLATITPADEEQRA